MYAIVKTGGKQYRVAPGDELNVELISGAEVGGDVVFDEVLMVGGEGGRIGTPRVEGASVKAKVLENGRGRKIVVFKSRRRKGYRKKRGHRQGYTRVQISEINA